jgi:hypothetical protein
VELSRAETETGAAWVSPWDVHGAHDLELTAFLFPSALVPLTCCCLLLLLIMSSADAWIASLGEESSAPSPFTSSVAGLQLSTGVSGSSGEYGGGGANLLFFVDENTLKRLWFVFFFGSGERRFCWKAVKDSSSTCGVVYLRCCQV